MKAQVARIMDESITPPLPATATQPAASVFGISKRFKKTSVLEDISFDVSEGESLVLLGASGSGKTTILRIIAGLEQPDSGYVILHDQDVTDLPARERGVGVIFQSYALFPRMTVEKNIAYGLKIRRRSRKEIRETVDRLIKLVELGDRIAVLNNGKLEQIGTPDEVYNHPATEFVAMFLGAANLLLGVATSGFVEIGTARLPAEKETRRFRDGQSVKLVFRPEDVCVSQDANLPEGCRRLTNGVIEEVNFVGAYERLTVRLDLTHRKGDSEELYEVTINTPQRMTGVPVMA